MNKADLIDAVHVDMGGTKAAAEFAVKSVIAHIEAGIKSGDGIQLVGFGSFTTATRAARKGRNPSSGAEINIPASTVVKWSTGKALKDALNPPTPKAKGKK